MGSNKLVETLKVAARSEVTFRMTGGRPADPDSPLHRAIEGVGTDNAAVEIVAAVETIVGASLRLESDSYFARANNARCRSQLVRWAFREANAQAARAS